MGATWTGYGKMLVNRIIVGLQIPNFTTWAVRLGMADTPLSGEDVTLADLVECDIPGYGSYNLQSIGWTNGSTSDTCTVNTTGGARWIFDPSGGDSTITYMFVTDTESGDGVVYYEAITPFAPLAGGDTLGLGMAIGDNTLPLP